eukprot:CAMPEP_0174946836 /NCGR_PEP_ID=MMETSP1355-20121228/85157_1 /TAXON_ID=464990 /ORGANISM="Hemiselmis tepida, Strain CCMP443" /LENGTH=382 /DNA_ID=CAMNT_0016194275 /DNA_START=18 /DNA_END=1162 /DNA_ORIENTATION=-
MYVGQKPKTAESPNLQMLTVRLPKRNETLDMPSGRFGNGTSRARVNLPATAFATQADAVASLDTVMVQWGRDIHMEAGRTLGSDVITINMTSNYGNGTTKVQKDSNEPILLRIPQVKRQDTNRIADSLDLCRFWNPEASDFTTEGATVHSLTFEKEVICEVYHLTDFASVLLQSFGNFDDIFVFNDANPFNRWTPDRMLAFLIVVLSGAVYAFAMYIGRQTDIRSLGELTKHMRKNRAEDMRVDQDPEQQTRARDYVMIKAILKHRMAGRYKSWKNQMWQMLKQEHALGGVLFRPVFSSFTRPRRITCLFIVFLGNITLNTLFLGREGFDVNARIAAGIVSAVIMFPIGLLFTSAFMSIDSEVTWRMHRRRRVRRVQESVAV